VVAQVALTLVLLVAALLLARTFAAIQAVDPGFRAAGVLTFRAPSATPRYETQEARDTLARSLQAALRSLPGVTAVGAASHLPFDAIPNWAGPYALAEGEGTEATLPSADYRSLLPGSLEAAGIRLVQGRSFTEADGPSGERVALVDELLAERAWPGRSPLGQRLRVDPGSSGAPDTWVSVVGVVRHVRHRSLLERLNPQVYFPLSQAFRNPVAWLVRGGGDPSELAPAVRAAVRQVDATLPVYELLPLSAYLERAQAVQRFTTILILAFAGAALVLAAIGVYGVIAYLVVERRREFGVRLALGATRAQIGALVLRQGARLTLLGAALGVAGALLSARLLGGLLYGVSPFDPLTYLAALPVLALAALAACVWPARRATRADVLDVLRAE
jgi:predicted permease